MLVARRRECATVQVAAKHLLPLLPKIFIHIVLNRLPLTTTTPLSKLKEFVVEHPKLRGIIIIIDVNMSVQLSKKLHQVVANLLIIVRRPLVVNIFQVLIVVVVVVVVAVTIAAAMSLVLHRVHAVPVL